MVKPSRLTPEARKFNLLIYGEPGVGKTTLAATAADSAMMAEVLVINMEGGMLSVSSRGDLWAVPVRNYKDLEEQFWALAHSKEEPYKSCKTVLIDSGTELQTLLLEERVMAQAQGKADRAVDTIYLEDYGYNTNQVRRMFRWFRDLPKHVIVTALVKRVYPKGVDDVTNATPNSVVPNFTDKVGQSVMGYFDFVWYQYLQEGERYLLTQDKGPYKAKTRGLHFAHAIGSRVRVRNLLDPEDSEGQTVATLMDLFVRCEGSQ